MRCVGAGELKVLCNRDGLQLVAKPAGCLFCADKLCGVLLQSGIHGWGLFARKQLKQDSMVIEYRGDLLRRTAADAREKAYQAAGKDCYLFTVNEDCVIDATMTGGIGRFTVRGYPL